MGKVGVVVVISFFFRLPVSQPKVCPGGWSSWPDIVCWPLFWDLHVISVLKCNWTLPCTCVGFQGLTTLQPCAKNLQSTPPPPPRNAPNFCCIEFYCSSYCLVHRPTQSVNLIESNGQTCPICLCEIDWNSRTSLAEVPLKTPCCRNSWFHNSCLQVINTGNLNETSLKSVWLPMDWVVDSDLWPKREPHVSLQMGKRVLSYDVDISLLTLGGFSWLEAPLLLITILTIIAKG